MDGRALLNGLLLGLGGTGKVAGDERENEQARQLRALQLIMEQRRLDATAKEAGLRREQDAQQFTEAQGLRRDQMGQQERLAMLPYELQKADAMARRAEAAQQTESTGRFLDEQSWAGSDPFSEKPTNPVMAMLAGLTRATGQAPDLKTILGSVASPETKKPMLVGTNQRMVDETGRVIVPAVDQPEKPEKPRSRDIQLADGWYSITEDAQGNEIARRRLGSAPPKEPREPAQPNTSQMIDQLMRERQALLRSGAPKTDPRVAELDERVNALRMWPVAPGGSLFGAADPTKPVVQIPQNPSPDERKDLADMKSIIEQTKALVGDVQKHGGVLGGFASNPIGALRRAGSGAAPGLTTPEEKSLLANLSFRTSSLKKELIGAAQTVPELKGLADALPDKWDATPNIIPKLQAIISEVESKIRNRTKVMPGAGRVTAPADPMGILQ